MLRFLIVTLAFLLISLPSIAQDKPYVDSAFCNALVKHHNSAEYKAGVNVHGKAVVSADLNNSQSIDIPDEYSFPLTVDIAEYMEMDIPAGLIGSARIGSLVVKKDGSVLFNNKSLDDNSTNALKSLCDVEKNKKEASSK